jgi:hypothetical protein
MHFVRYHPETAIPLSLKTRDEKRFKLQNSSTANRATFCNWNKTSQVAAGNKLAGRVFKAAGLETQEYCMLECNSEQVLIRIV